MKKSAVTTRSTLVLAAAITIVLTGCTPTSSPVESIPESTMGTTTESMPAMNEMPSEPENMDATEPDGMSSSDSSEFYMDDYSMYVERGALTQEQADQLMEAEKTVSDIYTKADEEAAKVNESVSSIRDLINLSDIEFYYNSYVDLAITQDEADKAIEAETNRNELYAQYSDLYNENEITGDASNVRSQELDAQIAQYDEILFPITNKINNYLWRTEYQGYVEEGVLSQDEADQVVSLLMERDKLWSEETSLYMDEIPDEDQQSELDMLYNDIDALSAQIDELTKNIALDPYAYEDCGPTSGV